MLLARDGPDMRAALRDPTSPIPAVPCGSWGRAATAPEREGLIIAWERSRNKASMSEPQPWHRLYVLVTADPLRDRHCEMVILDGVFHSDESPTTVRINIDGNAPIDNEKYTDTNRVTSHRCPCKHRPRPTV